MGRVSVCRVEKSQTSNSRCMAAERQQEFCFDKQRLEIRSDRWACCGRARRTIFERCRQIPTSRQIVAELCSLWWALLCRATGADCVDSLHKEAVRMKRAFCIAVATRS